MCRIVPILLIFTYSSVFFGGYCGEADLEDVLKQGIRGCKAGGNHLEETGTDNRSFYDEIDGASASTSSEGLRNETRPLETTVITFGTFDLLHVGHLNLLRRAKQLGNKLVVGICTDEGVKRNKGRFPVNSEGHRRDLVGAIRYVDEAFVVSKSKREHILEWGSNIFVMGSDHEGAYDGLQDICQVTYLPRTSGVSTTDIILKSCAKQP